MAHIPHIITQIEFSDSEEDIDCCGNFETNIYATDNTTELIKETFQTKRESTELKEPNPKDDDTDDVFDDADDAIDLTDDANGAFNLTDAAIKNKRSDVAIELNNSKSKTDGTIRVCAHYRKKSTSRKEKELARVLRGVKSITHWFPKTPKSGKNA